MEDGPPVLVACNKSDAPGAKSAWVCRGWGGLGVMTIEALMSVRLYLAMYMNICHTYTNTNTNRPRAHQDAPDAGTVSA